MVLAMSSALFLVLTPRELQAGQGEELAGAGWELSVQVDQG